MHRNTLSRKINEYGLTLDFRRMARPQLQMPVPARPVMGRAFQSGAPATAVAVARPRSAWG